MLQLSLRSGKPADFSGFDKKIGNWEWQWVNEQKVFPENPHRNSIIIAQELYRKYRPKYMLK
jgi:alpha-N-acetylglucosaminidase